MTDWWWLIDDDWLLIIDDWWLIIDCLHTDDTDGHGGPQADGEVERKLSGINRELKEMGLQADDGGERVLINDDWLLITDDWFLIADCYLMIDCWWLNIDYAFLRLLWSGVDNHGVMSKVARSACMMVMRLS